MTTTQHPADLYAAVRTELIQALRSLDAKQAATSVPACPLWTVKDVAAHLSGLNADILANVEGPLGSDEATGRQVNSRAALELAEVLDEWTSQSDAIDVRFRADEAKATGLLADLIVHVYDLAEILNQPTEVAAVATPMSAHRYISLLQERVLDRMDVGLTVELTDDTRWPASNAPTSVTVRTSPHDFLRGVTGRLRRSDVEAFEWSTDPTDILDSAWNQYGPFRT